MRVVSPAAPTRARMVGAGEVRLAANVESSSGHGLARCPGLLHCAELSPRTGDAIYDHLGAVRDGALEQGE